jgi:hypothetical protein
VVSTLVSPDLERRRRSAPRVRLSYFTIVWNGVLGLVALTVGLTIGSLRWLLLR